MADRPEIDRRVERAEDLMVQGLPSRKVEAALCAAYRVSGRQAQTYMSRVRERWRNEAGRLDREGKRDRMRASVEMLFHRAVSRTVVLRDANGKIIKDPKTKKPLTVEAPNLTAAIRAADLLIKLDGLPEPIKLEGVVGAEGLYAVLDEVKKRRERGKKGKRGRGGRKS